MTSFDFRSNAAYEMLRLTHEHGVDVAFDMMKKTTSVAENKLIEYKTCIEKVGPLHLQILYNYHQETFGSSLMDSSKKDKNGTEKDERQDERMTDVQPNEGVVSNNSDQDRVSPAAPASVLPTSAAPTSVLPMSAAPTSVLPTSAAPTSVLPTSAAPTSVLPTSAAPTSVLPTSGPLKGAQEEVQEAIPGKSIILYGKDNLKFRFGLEHRPALLIADATPDLDNLQSTKIGAVCEWLAGPHKGTKLSLRAAVNLAYGSEMNAFNSLCTNQEGPPQLISSLRKERRSARGVSVLNGQGFAHLLYK